MFAHKKTILLSILSILVFVAFQRMFQWDVADRELAKYPNSVAILVSESGKYSGTNVRKSQFYIVIPTALNAFTVSIQSDNGVVSVDEDEYGALKWLLLIFVVVPLLSRLAKKLGFSKFEIKG